MNNYERSEVEVFFDRPEEVVAEDTAASWVRHEDRKKVSSGHGRIFALQTLSGSRLLYRLESAVVYGSDYTKQRWPHSRGPEIEQLRPGDVIGYTFHQYTLPFTKIGGSNSAANMQFSKLREIDKSGEPIPGDEAEIGGGELSKKIGLHHGGLAFLTPFNFRGDRAFLLAVGARQFSQEELKRIEEEILGEFS